MIVVDLILPITSEPAIMCLIAKLLGTHIMKRLITLSVPGNNFQKTFQTEILSKSPYDFVELLRENLNKCSETKVDNFANFEIGNILPIHNLSGIRDFNQIQQMRDKIKEGEEIFEKNFFPNIKLILTPNEKLLLFDGTHSLLAYFLAGRKLLKDIPYLVITSENFGPVTVDELAYFFPEEDRGKVTQDFEKYVVNWQVEKGKHLELREVNSIAELASQFRERDKSAIEE